jgi:hypothetical protein
VYAVVVWNLVLSTFLLLKVALFLAKLRQTGLQFDTVRYEKAVVESLYLLQFVPGIVAPVIATLILGAIVAPFMKQLWLMSVCVPLKMKIASGCT